MSSAAIIVFVKLPLPGLVKTRLARGVGPAAAACFYRACATHILHQAAGSGLEADCLTVAFAPSSQQKQVEVWLWSISVSAKEEASNLGQRMRAALEQALSAGAGKVVLGPAHDGGFYLIGAARTVPAMLEGITWSAATVLAETAAQLRGCGLSVAPLDTLPKLLDIDTAEDLKRWVEVERSKRAGGHHPVLPAAEEALQERCPAMA